MQTNLMQCAAYGLITDRLTPTSSTSAAMLAALIHLFPQTQPLDMTLSMCTQLLWSTTARPVLSGTCPVKPLYDLGHRAAAQFQGLGNLLIAYAIFMYSNTYFFQILRKFFAMRCHVELPVRAITPNLTHLLPIHTWDLVTLTSHMTLGRENS